MSDRAPVRSIPMTWPSRCGFLAALMATTHVWAAIPVPLGQVDVGAITFAARASVDAKRVVLAVGDMKSGTLGIRVVDTSRPENPALQGFIPVSSSFYPQKGEGCELALSPDGSRAIVSAWSSVAGPIKSNWDVTLIDLSDPAKPVMVWHRHELMGGLTLAANASAYAGSIGVPGSKENPQRVIIKWTNGGRDTVLAGETGDGQLSDGGHLFAGTADEIGATDLRSGKPVYYEQGWSGSLEQSSACAIARDDGTIVTADLRAKRIGIYASQPKVPRISTIATNSNLDVCERVNFNDDSGDLLYRSLWDVVRLDLRDPKHPSVDAFWHVPSGIYTAAGGVAFAAAGPHQLQLFRLPGAVRFPVDWQTLERAHDAALKHYTEVTNAGGDAAEATLRALEDAGILNAINAQVTGITNKAAAGILSDYGFLSGKTKDQFHQLEVGESALRRSIILDPSRAVAKLNLADLLRARASSPPPLRGADDYARAVEIAALYKDYLNSGGKQVPRVRAYVGTPSTSPNMCTAIAAKATSGSLAEILYTAAAGVRAKINGSDASVDLYSNESGTAHIPGVVAYDAATDELLPDDAIALPGGGGSSSEFESAGMSGNQYGFVEYLGKMQILYYRDLHNPLESSSPLDGTFCSFSSETEKTVGDSAKEPALCRDILTPGKHPAPLEFTTAASIDEKDLHSGSVDRNPRAVGDIDAFNDGKPVSAVRVEMSSTAGAGCATQYFDLVDATGEHFASGARRDLFLQLQADGDSACGSSVQLFTYGGRVYAETTNDSNSEVDTVNRIENDMVVDVCDFKFNTIVSAKSR